MNDNSRSTIGLHLLLGGLMGALTLVFPLHAQEVSEDLDDPISIGTKLVVTAPDELLEIGGPIQADQPYSNFGSRHLTHTHWFNTRTIVATINAKGYLKLVTPIVHNESNMFSIKIKGFAYGDGGKPIEIRCGGYAYIDGSLIRNDCRTEGSDVPVGMGVENDVVIITIGSGISEDWYYDHFTFEYSGWKAKNPDGFEWIFVENGVPTTSNTNLVFFDDSGGDSFITGGNLGIGTTSPTERLEVIGNMKLSGNIDADGIICDATGCIGSGSDNLGNHVATQNIRLNGKWLSGDGGNEGITVDNLGKVGVGTATPDEALEVSGNIKLSGSIVSDGDICIGSGC